MNNIPGDTSKNYNKAFFIRHINARSVYSARTSVKVLLKIKKIKENLEKFQDPNKKFGTNSFV